jgi:ribosome-associated toxin RatA of RatAB toxin-antitoxin module
LDAQPAGAEPVIESLPAVPHPCVACGLDADAAWRAYAGPAREALSRGEVVTWRGGQGGAGEAERGQAEAAIVVAHSPVQVWDVITDFESRPRYVPTAEKVRIVRTAANQVWVSQHLRFLWVDVHFQAINTLEPELGVVRWRLDPDAPHDIADTTGSWQIVPLPRGRTLVHYRAHLDSGQPVPRIVEEFIAGRSLTKMMEGLRDELRRRSRP